MLEQFYTNHPLLVYWLLGSTASFICMGLAFAFIGETLSKVKKWDDMEWLAFGATVVIFPIGFLAAGCLVYHKVKGMANAKA